MWSMYDWSLLPEYWQKGQKESFLEDLPPASTLVSIGRWWRLSLTWSSCRRQTAVIESCECVMIKFGLPNALALCRKLAQESMVGPQIALLDRSGTDHTHLSSLVQRPCGSSCNPGAHQLGQAILPLCRVLHDHESSYHVYPILGDPH